MLINVVYISLLVSIQILVANYVSESITDYYVDFNDPEDYPVDYPLSTDEVENSDVAELKTTMTLINGSVKEIMQIPVEEVINSLPLIQKMDLSYNKKLLIWSIIKGNKSVTHMNVQNLKTLGTMLLFVPEPDIYLLNVSDWDIVEFLGEFKGLSRRQVGIIGYALKHRWGYNIIKDIDIVNRINGLVCGFSPREINEINSLDFIQIGKQVFKNLYACTSRQKQVLLETAMSSTAYGPPQVWNKDVTDRLGLLIAAMDIDILRSIRNEAMEGVSSDTIEAMEDHLTWLSPDQVDYLNDMALATFRRKFGIKSNCIAVHLSIHLFYLMALLIISIIDF